MEQTPRAVKIVLYGKEGVGKSALMMRYVYGGFTLGMESTIGASFSSKNIQIDSGKLTLQIWDTAGSERFNSIVPIYIRGAKVVLLCFDEPNIETLETKISKIKEINDQATILFVVTKCDILEDQSQFDSVVKYATSHHHKLFYTSSLTGYGITDLFDHVINISSEPVLPLSNITLRPPEDNKQTKTCCGTSYL